MPSSGPSSGSSSGPSSGKSSGQSSGSSSGKSIPDGVVVGDEDGKPRCWWAGQDPEYIAYHDDEWGRWGHPVATDAALFEMLTLEGAQAGLSWITILRKRNGYREAFDGFDLETIASYDQDKMEELRGNAGIVRNKLKIKATVRNAQLALELIDEFGSLDAFFRAQMGGWEPGCVLSQPHDDLESCKRTSMAEATAISKTLHARGFRFVGPTIVLSFLQAVGYVNDHVPSCFTRSPQP